MFIFCFLCQLFLYRILSTHTADPDNKRLLLDGLSHMQLAVTLQEHVAQRIQDLLNPEEEVNNVHMYFTETLLVWWWEKL